MQPSVLQRKIKKKRTCLGGRGEKKKPHLPARIGWLWCFVLETGNHIVYLAQESRRHSRRRRRKRNVSIIREWRREGEERKGRRRRNQLATGNGQRLDVSLYDDDDDSSEWKANCARCPAAGVLDLCATLILDPSAPSTRNPRERETKRERERERENNCNRCSACKMLENSSVVRGEGDLQQPYQPGSDPHKPENNTKMKTKRNRSKFVAISRFVLSLSHSLLFLIVLRYFRLFWPYWNEQRCLLFAFLLLYVCVWVTC